MKVLYTHRTQAVGAEGAHIQGMYDAFRELGHTVAMHCLPGCNPSDQASAERNSANVFRKPPLLKRLYTAITEAAPQIVFECFELAYNVPLFLQLLYRCRQFRPDLVYERYALNTFAPTLVCRLLHIKHVLEINDSVVIERSRPLRLKGVAAFFEAYCLSRSELLITITERFRKQLLDRFGIPPAKLLMLTNAVSRSRFDKQFDAGTIRKKLGIGNARAVGGTGQFLEWHGLQDLVEQLGPSARELDVYFLFVGDGPAREGITERAHVLGIADRVHFTGMMPIQEVPHYLSALDIAVIPNAALHASPMKLIEYMAMGLPIVAPDLPSIRAALNDGSLGKIFPAGDMVRMKQGILDFLANPVSAADAGRRAKEYVFTHLTWDGHARRIIALIAQADHQ